MAFEDWLVEIKLVGKKSSVVQHYKEDIALGSSPRLLQFLSKTSPLFFHFKGERLLLLYGSALYNFHKERKEFPIILLKLPNILLNLRMVALYILRGNLLFF